MHFEIRQNIPAYLADLNHWLAETRDDPLEEMSNFFTERVSTYEEHMARWNEAYRSMASRSATDVWVYPPALSTTPS